MRKIEIGYVRRHTVGIRQAGTGVLFRVPGKCAGFLHGFPQSFEAEIRAARTTFPVATENGHTNTSVIRVFQIFHRPEPRSRPETDVVTGSDFCLIGALFFSLGKHQPHDILDIATAHRLARSTAHLVAIPPEKNFNVCMTLYFPDRVAGAQ
jgi:hypothetical protein